MSGPRVRTNELSNTAWSSTADTSLRTNTSFYYLLEAESFEAVSAFLGPPLLQDHDGHIAPILTLGEAVETLLEE